MTSSDSVRPHTYLPIYPSICPSAYLHNYLPTQLSDQLSHPHPYPHLNAAPSLTELHCRYGKQNRGETKGYTHASPTSSIRVYYYYIATRHWGTHLSAFLRLRFSPLLLPFCFPVFPLSLPGFDILYYSFSSLPTFVVAFWAEYGYTHSLIYIHIIRARTRVHTHEKRKTGEKSVCAPTNWRPTYCYRPFSILRITGLRAWAWIQLGAVYCLPPLRGQVRPFYFTYLSTY